MRSLWFVFAMVLTCVGVSQAQAEEHHKPAHTAKAGDTRKHLLDAGKSKKVEKALPAKVDASFHHDGHFGHDGIKAIYSVPGNLWWVEVTEGGKDFLLEFNNDGVLQAIAFEKADGLLVIVIEGDDGYLWAVDEEGNAVAFQV